MALYDVEIAIPIELIRFMTIEADSPEDAQEIADAWFDQGDVPDSWYRPQEYDEETWRNAGFDDLTINDVLPHAGEQYPILTWRPGDPNLRMDDVEEEDESDF